MLLRLTAPGVAFLPVFFPYSLKGFQSDVLPDVSCLGVLTLPVYACMNWMSWGVLCTARLHGLADDMSIVLVGKLSMDVSHPDAA